MDECRGSTLIINTRYRRDGAQPTRRRAKEMFVAGVAGTSLNRLSRSGAQSGNELRSVDGCRREARRDIVSLSIRQRPLCELLTSTAMRRHI